MGSFSNHLSDFRPRILLGCPPSPMNFDPTAGHHFDAPATEDRSAVSGLFAISGIALSFCGVFFAVK